jgi:hypothetical protein
MALSNTKLSRIEELLLKRIGWGMTVTMVVPVGAGLTEGDNTGVVEAEDRELEEDPRSGRRAGLLPLLFVLK